MSAELCVLGAGSILPRLGYGCAGYALRRGAGRAVTLLDCGPGSVRALASVGVELADVRRVVLSHFHLDHCLDVFALAFARRNPRFSPPPPLELVGPPGLARWIGRAPEALGRWASDPAATVREVETDGQGRGGFEADGMSFRCVRTGHCPEALAWRIELEEGGSLAYTGDTGPNPAVAELARGVDLFVVECSFPDELAVPQHLSPASAGRMLAEALPASGLLTHFYPELDPAQAAAQVATLWDGVLRTARDGAVQALRG
jgi:ribonuclease BN (tRNA processing enzyme)